VSFTPRGRLHYLDPGALWPRVGDLVLVPTDDGPEVATCVWAGEEVPEVDEGRLPLLAGMATEADLARDASARQVRATGRLAAKRLVRELGLTMKVVGVDWRPDAAVGGELVVFFSAPGRVDFRQLVRDLGVTVGAKVTLTQLGARDEARAMGGIGPCGRDTCCSSFLKDFEPVTMRMARDQDLPPNPLRISGACGKLLCCLRYEHPLYESWRADAPVLGSTVETPQGLGRVLALNVPGDTVTVRLEEGGGRCSCSKADVCSPREAYDTR